MRALSLCESPGKYGQKGLDPLVSELRALRVGRSLTGEIQKGTGGRGRDRKCHTLSQIVVTFYDEFYDHL